jgi:hypothetical protein
MIRKERASVLDLIPARATVIAYLASRKALDRVLGGEAHTIFRIAADEVWLVSSREARAETLAAARRLLIYEPSALVIDQTDGWAAWTLRGEAEEAFARLSIIPLPDAGPSFLQGFVAHLPAKVIATLSALHILVPAPVSHHLRDRVLAACADLDVQLTGEEELSLERDNAVRMQPAGSAS